MLMTTAERIEYRDLALSDLADENAALRELRDQLIDLLADLTLENVRFRLLYDREFLSRFHGDVTIQRLRRHLRGRDDDDQAEASDA